MAQEKGGLRIGAKAFITSAVIILCLMIAAGMLTKIIPAGAFERTVVDGRELIVMNSFSYTPELSYPVYRWFTAPFEVLLSSDAASVIVIVAFICTIGGTFFTLDKSGMLSYLMSSLVRKFSGNKYRLLMIVTFAFMLFGSTLGLFEELVALVPIVVALACSLGWDSLTGLGMSALASGFGFAAATLNPFTIGVAQKLAGLPMFSGLLFRIPVFAVIYLILATFLLRYAKKIEKKPELSSVYHDDLAQRTKYSQEKLIIEPENAKDLQAATKVFGAFLLLILVTVIAGFFVPIISDLSMPLIALLFLVGGILASIRSRYGKTVGRDFLKGLLGIAPAAVLILMAMSVKLIVTKGGVLDTMLFYASDSIAKMNPSMAALMIYALVLVLNFFIGSGSAKAFLVIPIIAPLTELVGVTRQVAVSAFCFGDGFSNMLYPTNPVLMIALGFTVVSYPKWLRWSLPVQLITLAVTIIILLIAVAINYGPY